jgi:endonuclease III
MGANGTTRLYETLRILDETYGPRPWHRHGDPVEVLVSTILSQNTSDVNTDRAFASLRARFPTWDAIRTASPEEIVDAIRSGGLANQKGPRIQRALQSILDDRGDFDLTPLVRLPVDEARAELMALDGVGPKTAAIVLLFSLHLPVMPVDTHVYRVAWRLELIPRSITPEKAHDVLTAMLGNDPDRLYAVHMEMIAHGRAVCHARNPACDICPLLVVCPFGQLRVKASLDER